jgi:hypothetical protein
MVQNKDEVNRKRRIYREKNKTKINKQKRELYSKKKKELNKTRRKKYEQNKEKHNAWKRAYRAIPENRERINRQQRENRTKNPQHYRAKDKERREKNQEKYNRTRRKYYQNILKPKYEEIKYLVFSHYSKKLSKSEIPCCNCCGESFDIVFLALDHIQGRKKMGHRPTHTGIKIYREIIKNNFPDGFQVLCHNCNFAKFQLGVCPHKKQ